MPRCARSSTSLVWGIPVHPTHLLRAIRTHQRLLPIMKALRGCHAFAPDPPQSVSYPSLLTPPSPHAVSTDDILSRNKCVTQCERTEGPFISVMQDPRLVVEDLTFEVVSPTAKCRGGFGHQRKGIASVPMEILNLIEMEVVLSAHEEDVPRTLVDAVDESSIPKGRQPHLNMPGWSRVCVCGERYEETMDVVRCREKVMAEVGSRETQKYLLKYFGLTTAVICTPLKHAIVLLILPSKVSALPALLNTIPALPMHPPISKQVLSSYPYGATELTGGRLPLSKTYLSRASSHPPVIAPLVTPSDDFLGHLHPGMFAQNHWRLRNQNSGIRASLVNPSYTSLTEEMIRRVRWCVEGLVLWKAARVAREELGYEELACIEHFNMALIPDKGHANDPTHKEIAADSHIDTFNQERSLQGEDRKNISGRQRERERNYWGAAIKPSLWLLEELTYEP